MNRAIIILLGLIFSAPLFSQTCSLKGNVKDENGVILNYVTVVLLHPADSTLAYYSVTDDRGNFIIRDIKSGKYILQSSLMGHSTVYMPVDINTSAVRDLNIEMKTTPVALKEVVVADEHIPMRFKHDTIEYNTAAFPTHPGAVAEDLLKKLPGIEVDRAGNIKALGEDIKKVLVDGREFFGSDQKLATRNIPADALRKIQVYDKKSDESEFTGIDDGVREKTVNLMLKENRKNSIFGELLGGAGPGDHFQANAKVYKFTPKNQFAALGMLNNINQFGFSFKDYIDFNGGLQSLSGHSGGLQIRIPSGGGSDFPVNFGQPVTGLSSSGAFGLNFSREYKKDSRFFTSVIASGSDKNLRQTSFSKNFTGTEEFDQSDSTDERTSGRSLRLNLGLRNRIDSTRNFNVNGDVTLSYGKTYDLNRTFLDQSGILLSNMHGRRNERANRLDGDLSASYVKLLKQGKTVFRLGGNVRYAEDTGKDSWLNQTFDPQNPEGIVNSLFRNDNNTTIEESLNTSLTIKPSKKFFLEPAVDAGRRTESLGRSMGQATDIFLPVDTLSPSFKSGYDWIRPAIRLIHNTDKVQITLGLQAEAGKTYNSLNGAIGVSKTSMHFTPELSWEYEYATGRRLRIYYRSNINVPTIDQLLPVTDYYNPLILTSGNRYLKPEFVHNLTFNWWYFDQFSFTSLLADLNATYTGDKINWERNVDQNLLQTMKLINVADDYRVEASGSFSTPVRFLGIKINADVDESWNRGTNFINNVENININFVHRLSLSFENRNKTKIDFTAGGSGTITDARFSVQKSMNNRFTELSGFADITYTPSKRWNMTMNSELTHYSSGSFNKASTIPLTGFSISYFFLKELRGAITLQCTDILNRDTGIERFNEFNYLREQRSNMLGRLFMFSFKYRLNKSAGDHGNVDVKVSRRR